MVTPAVINTNDPLLLVANPSPRPETLYKGQHLSSAVPLLEGRIALKPRLILIPPISIYLMPKATGKLRYSLSSLFCPLPDNRHGHTTSRCKYPDAVAKSVQVAGLGLCLEPNTTTTTTRRASAACGRPHNVLLCANQRQGGGGGSKGDDNDDNHNGQRTRCRDRE
ncbi:hypothetical protein OSTOST_02641 [Ostertagia ostertagi]